VALTIFTFITAWNSFLWPLIVTTSDSMRTIILGLSVLKGNYSTNYGLVMAGAVLTFFPPFIVFLLLQKRFVEGVTLSGIKG
jgi:multiple sugar transport system permease protein